MQVGVPIGALIAGAVGTRFTRAWEVPDKIDRLEKMVDLFIDRLERKVDLFIKQTT